MIFSRPQLVLLAERASLDAGVEPSLLCGLCDVASDWNPGKLEYHHNLTILFDAWRDVDPREEAYQNYRWGVSQVLGSSAREAGYQKPLGTLIEPIDNLSIAACVLRKCLDQCGGNADRGLVLWYRVIGSAFPTLVLSKAPAYREFLSQPNRLPQLPTMDTPFEPAPGGSPADKSLHASAAGE